jgi:hypothetical protein
MERIAMLTFAQNITILVAAMLVSLGFMAWLNRGMADQEALRGQ